MALDERQTQERRMRASARNRAQAHEIPRIAQGAFKSFGNHGRVTPAHFCTIDHRAGTINRDPPTTT